MFTCDNENDKIILHMHVYSASKYPVDTTLNHHTMCWLINHMSFNFCNWDVITCLYQSHVRIKINGHIHKL